MGFTKLDEGILRSSIMAEDPATFKIWIALLAACRQDGIADVSAVFLASVCHMDIKTVHRALAKLEAPDSDSRSTADEGKRIRRVDGGYKIINYFKYREKSVREVEAQKKREQRAGKPPQEGFVYFARFKDRIKIGFSKNPYSRISEFKVAMPDICLLGMVKGTQDDELNLHKKYAHLNIDREWFREDEQLGKNIDEILRNKAVVLDYGSVVQEYSASASASASEDKNPECETRFAEFWAAYPREGRHAKKESMRKFAAICKRGELDRLIKGFHGYVDFLKMQKDDRNFEQRPMYAKTFLNGRWEEFVEYKHEPRL